VIGFQNGHCFTPATCFNDLCATGEALLSGDGINSLVYSLPFAPLEAELRVYLNAIHRS
jgi:hypothetical protein